MTGAEALQKILETVDTLHATVSEMKTSILLIEQSIKVLNNRAGGLLKQQTETGSNLPENTDSRPFSAGVPNHTPKQTIQVGPSRGRQLIETEQNSNDVISREANDSSKVLTYKKVFGRLVNNTNEPIENVLIKIYDKNNEICASAETDPIGYWETMLKPGRYVAEYTKTGFKTANKTFEVGSGAKEVEVK